MKKKSKKELKIDKERMKGFKMLLGQMDPGLFIANKLLRKIIK